MRAKQARCTARKGRQRDFAQRRCITHYADFFTRSCNPTNNATEGIEGKIEQMERRRTLWLRSIGVARKSSRCQSCSRCIQRCISLTSTIRIRYCDGRIARQNHKGWSRRTGLPAEINLEDIRTLCSRTSLQKERIRRIDEVGSISSRRGRLGSNRNNALSH